MKQSNLRLLIEQHALVRLLMIIENEKCHTRELLNILGEWGYGHKLLLKAYELGLIERERVKPEGRGNWRVYNMLSKRGKEVLKLAKEIGIK